MARQGLTKIEQAFDNAYQLNIPIRVDNLSARANYYQGESRPTAAVCATCPVQVGESPQGEVGRSKPPQKGEVWVGSSRGTSSAKGILGSSKRLRRL